jgi:hypothetical protein
MEKIIALKKDGKYIWNDDFREHVNRELGTAYPSWKALKSAHTRYQKQLRKEQDQPEPPQQEQQQQQVQQQLQQLQPFIPSPPQNEEVRQTTLPESLSLVLETSSATEMKATELADSVHCNSNNDYPHGSPAHTRNGKSPVEDLDLTEKDSRFVATSDDTTRSDNDVAEVTQSTELEHVRGSGPQAMKALSDEETRADSDIDRLTTELEEQKQTNTALKQARTEATQQVKGTSDEQSRADRAEAELAKVRKEIVRVGASMGEALIHARRLMEDEKTRADNAEAEAAKAKEDLLEAKTAVIQARADATQATSKEKTRTDSDEVEAARVKEDLLKANTTLDQARTVATQAIAEEKTRVDNNLLDRLRNDATQAIAKEKTRADSAEVKAAKAMEALLKANTALDQARTDAMQAIAKEKNRADSANTEAAKAKEDLLKANTALDQARTDATRAIAKEKTRADSAEEEAAKAKEDLLKANTLLDQARNHATQQAKARSDEKTRADRAEAEVTKTKEDLVTSRTTAEHTTQQLRDATIRADNAKKQAKDREDDTTRFQAWMDEFGNSTEANTSKVADLTKQIQKLKRELETAKRQVKDGVNSEDVDEASSERFTSTDVPSETATHHERKRKVADDARDTAYNKQTNSAERIDKNRANDRQGKEPARNVDDASSEDTKPNEAPSKTAAHNKRRPKGANDTRDTNDNTRSIPPKKTRKRRGAGTKDKDVCVSPPTKTKKTRWPLYGNGILYKLPMWQAKPRQEVCDAIDAGTQPESEVGCHVLSHTTSCSLTNPRCDTYVSLFAQRSTLLADCDLTNACAVISFEVAQYVLAHHNFPCDTVLAGLIEKSANKTRFMRQMLRLVPDKYEEIDLDEMLHVIAGLYNNVTMREPLVKVFPRDNHNPVNFLTWSTFHGVFTNEDFFKLLQERVEATIKKRGICALSFYLRSHYITGYFNTQVPIFLFVTYLLAHNRPTDICRFDSPLFPDSREEITIYRLTIQ